MCGDGCHALARISVHRDCRRRYQPAFCVAEPDRLKPVRFMCEGEMISGDATHRSNLSVAFDVSTGTVEVAGWGEASTTSKLDADTLTFEARPGTVGGQSKGAINRITGRAAIVVHRSGFEVYSMADVAQASGFA